MRCIMGKMGILLSDWPSKSFKNVKRFLIGLLGTVGDHAWRLCLLIDGVINRVSGNSIRKTSRKLQLGYKTQFKIVRAVIS